MGIVVWPLPGGNSTLNLDLLLETFVAVQFPFRIVFRCLEQPFCFFRSSFHQGVETHLSHQEFTEFCIVGFFRI